MYQRMQITLSGVQLGTGSSLSSLAPEGAPVLFPCSCTAHVDLHRASGDALLPQAKALLEIDHIRVQLNSKSAAVLHQSLMQSSTEDGQDDRKVVAQPKVNGPSLRSLAPMRTSLRVVLLLAVSADVI